jgi:uncharacterized protein (TIGR03000 family)
MMSCRSIISGAAAFAAVLLTAPAWGHGGGHGGGGHGGGGHGGGGFHASGGFHATAGGFRAGGISAGGFRAGGASLGGYSAGRAVTAGRAAFGSPAGTARPYAHFVASRRFYRPYAFFYPRFFRSGLGGVGLYPYGYGLYYPYNYYDGYGSGYDNPYLGYAGYYDPDADLGQAVVPAGDEAPPRDDAAHLLIQVPADAELWFDGVKTQKTGTEREFVSPTLTPGKDYTYDVRARWNQDGRVVEKKRTLHVHANMWAAVDLTQPEPAEMPKVP